MDVLAGWKKLLGKDWESTYAASNSIYVTRQNNILFSVLVQFMGEEAIGNRLLLLETTEFTTTPEKMLDLLGRIVSDQALGQLFFKDDYLMDAELLSGGGRKVIVEEATKRGMKPLLPPRGAVLLQRVAMEAGPEKGQGTEEPRRGQITYLHSTTCSRRSQPSPMPSKWPKIQSPFSERTVNSAPSFKGWSKAGS